MRCPECHAQIEASAAACTNCGLILVKLAPPKRRAEDFAGQRRRANDQLVPCRFCGGEISPKAIRCRHCSEIINDDYYRERAQRIRARVNYASWVAYLFGFGALLVFRPVGALSIGAGLLLSIVYYALPVEPPSSRSATPKQSLGTILRSQFRVERVAIPLPALRSRKLIFVGTPLLAAIIGFTANRVLLQEPVNQVLKENAAFRGMQVSAHYEYYVIPGVVVYDLRELSFRQTPIDVHTAFLEFAKKLRNKRYTRVELSYKGHTKFSLSGSDFRRVGEEYAKRNFDFVLYNVPRLFHAERGTKPPDAAASDRDALLQFHRQWYGEDALTHSVNGM